MAVQLAMTLEEFLTWESAQETKHEYCRGRVIPHNVAMPGGSTTHNRVENNLVFALNLAFRRSECEVFTSNQTIMSVERGVGFYPDASVFCAPLEKRRYGTLDAATSPVAVFEVASPSTRSYDETYKLETYRAMSSMREVFLLSADEARVERWFRSSEDGWASETLFAGSFEALGRRIPLARLYKNVEFPTE